MPSQEALSVQPLFLCCQSTQTRLRATNWYSRAFSHAMAWWASCNVHLSESHFASRNLGHSSQVLGQEVGPCTGVKGWFDDSLDLLKSVSKANEAILSSRAYAAECIRLLICPTRGPPLSPTFETSLGGVALGMRERWEIRKPQSPDVTKWHDMRSALEGVVCLIANGVRSTWASQGPPKATLHPEPCSWICIHWITRLSLPMLLRGGLPP